MNQHIVPRKKNWAVIREGAKKASKRFTYKEDAWEYAVGLSKKHGSCTVEHSENGKIRFKDCDPRFYNQHVLKEKDGWAVLTPGKDLAYKSFSNKGAAMSHAYKKAKKHDVCMVIHNSKGDYKSVNCPPENSPSLFDSLRMNMGV